jgi:hypothetical protein
MTRETSSAAASSRTRPDRCADVPTTADREDAGGAYTLGNDGAVTEDGLEFSPVSPVEVVGDSGGASREADSTMRERDMVKSSD